jgi:hypothetical protein
MLQHSLSIINLTWSHLVSASNHLSFGLCVTGTVLCWHYIFMFFFFSSRETLREMPESLTIKRTIKRKLIKSVSQKSKHTPLSVWKRLKYRLSMSLEKVSWSSGRQTSLLLVFLPSICCTVSLSSISSPSSVSYSPSLPPHPSASTQFPSASSTLSPSTS